MNKLRLLLIIAVIASCGLLFFGLGKDKSMPENVHVNTSASLSEPGENQGTERANDGTEPAHRAGLSKFDTKERHIPGAPIPLDEVTSSSELEKAVDELGKAIETDNLQSLPDSAIYVWPDIINAFKAYSTGKADNEEEMLVGEYLFGTQDARKRLGEALCLERLDRVWSKVSESRSPDQLPPFAHCPSYGTAYSVDNSCLSCPRHGLSLSFPHRTAAKSLEDVSQLALGYFSHDRISRLDAAIIGDSKSAVKPGETVADVGCGVGCYLWSMARGAGAKGKVIAVDVDDNVLRFVKFVSGKRGAGIETRKVTRENFGFAPNSLDRVFLIDVLNVIAGTELKVGGKISSRTDGYMRGLIKAIKPGGHLVIIDFPPESTRPHISSEEARGIIEPMGMKLEALCDLELPEEAAPMYVATFVK